MKFPTRPIEFTPSIPTETTVVIIGGGIIGLTAALTLSERGIPVTLLEKGTVGAEQSTRNLGWIRKLNRSAKDMPLAIAAEALWHQLPQPTGKQVGYKQAGIMFVARTDDEMEPHRKWLASVENLSLDARLVTNAEISTLAPGSSTQWAGGIYMASDGYAEPTLTCNAVATAAFDKGAKIIENCAVRKLSLSGGKISGVITEHGEIKCDQVLLAGGLWSRRLLKSHNVALPSLPLLGSVVRTHPFDGPTDIATGASNFSFRKRIDGGYTIMQRGALDAPITPEHLLLGHKYLDALKANMAFLRPRIDRYFFEDLVRGVDRSGRKVSPFERNRIGNPPINRALLDEAMTELRKSWPTFNDAKISNSWAGLIDMTPDGEPVISHVNKIPGLTLATGFSGHGFGTSPAAGQLAADLVMNVDPLVDPSPYAFERFS